MKKALLIGASLVVSLGTAAQTLNVVVGEVTYKIPASQAGSMDYADGSRLTILGKTFQLKEVTRMYVDHSDVADNSVNVTYNGSAAAVTVAGNCMSHLDVTVNGSAVSIVQDETVDTEISYLLSGASDNGSFYMDGHYKATVVFDNLSLTCADSAAVNIENGKRIAIQLVGESTLKDSKASQGKGALMVNGHSEFDGDGTLNLYGYAKHAYWADEYVQLKKKFTGTINILYAKKDGLNVNQYFLQNGGHFNVSGTLDDGIQVSADDEEGGYATISGGSLTIDVTAAGSKGLKCDGNITIDDSKSAPTVTITNSGKGKWDSDDQEVKGAACMSSDANVTIAAGQISLTATGSGGKGLKCDSTLTITGGDLSVTTTGTTYVNIGGNQEYDGNYRGQLDRLDDAYSTSPKGIKVGIKATESSTGLPVGDIQISGGNIHVTCSGQQDGSEGIESKGTLTISGGTIDCNTYDDAINSSSHMYIKGGTITVYSSGNDGLDSNGNLYFSGGTTVAYGTRSPECGIDANEEEGYTVFFTGGNVLGIGGGNNSHPTTQESTQGYVTYSGNVTAGYTLTVNKDGTVLATFTLPYYYSRGNVILTAEGMTAGEQYTVSDGTSTQTLSAVQYGNGGPGGGGRPGGGGGPGGGGHGGW